MTSSFAEVEVKILYHIPRADPAPLLDIVRGSRVMEK